MRDNTLKLWLLAVSATLLLPFNASAAGLGRLTVLSTLSQPLNAEVELLAVQKGETITGSRLHDVYRRRTRNTTTRRGQRVTSKNGPTASLSQSDHAAVGERAFIEISSKSILRPARTSDSTRREDPRVMARRRRNTTACSQIGPQSAREAIVGCGAPMRRSRMPL